MASKRKSFVTGKSTAELLNMSSGDISGLTRSQLAQVVSRIASAANKRLRGLERAGIVSPAYKRVMESGGKISTRGKNLNQLRAEFLRAKQFMDAKTSSVTGYKKVIENTAKKLRDAGVTNANASNVEDLLKIYDRLTQLDPNAKGRGLKYKLLNAISDQMYIDPNARVDEVAYTMQKQLDAIIEENEISNNDDFSEWFDVEDDL